MKYSLKVSSSSGNYDIEIGSGLVRELDRNTTFLLDPLVKTKLPTPLNHSIEIMGNEQSKTLLGCEQVILGMRENGVRRGDIIIAVGGGVIQDVATLSTSLYMRGIDWEYVPTTLMSMADSCIGGKSSINAGGVKNLVGNFHPPKKITIDPVFLMTLPQQALTSGLAEAAKICFAKGPDAFNAFISSSASLAPKNNDETAHLIYHVLSSKQWFVEIDEFDKKERQLLNFGHSFGHAWESACNFSIQHGVAVAVGIIAALNHPNSISSDLTSKLRQYCLAILEPLREEIQQSTNVSNWEIFKESLASDKKNSSEFLRLILPRDESELHIVELKMDDFQLKIATNAIQRALEEIVS